MTMTIAPEAPEALAARAYMKHKGYDSEPLGVDSSIKDELCWYFYFEVPEGLIELEVEYGPQGEFPVETWRCQVSMFWQYDEMEAGWTPRNMVQQILASAEGSGG